MSADVEILSYLKKSLGIITKILEENGVVVRGISINQASDHVFIPEVLVDENGLEIDVNGILLNIKVDDNPCKFNLDRPITDTEYSVVFPGTIKSIQRTTNKIYLKAPQGHVSKVRIEALVI